MVWTQVRREPALRLLAWFVPAAVVLGTAIQMLLGTREIEPAGWSDGPQGLYPGLFIVWSCLVIFMLNAGAANRGPGPLEPALPLAARRVWVIHVLSIVLGVAVILATMGGVVALGNALQGRGPLVSSGLLALGAHLAVGFLLTVSMLQAPQPALYRRSFRGRYAGFVVTCVGLYGAFTVLMSAVPAAWGLVAVGVGLLLGWRTYHRIPASFCLAELGPESGSLPESSSTDVGTEGWTPARRAWRLHFAIWRNPVGNWALFYPAIMVIHGFALSWSRAYDQRVPYVFFSLTILLAWLMVSLRRLHTIDSWPVSRRRVMAVLVCPMLLGLAAGYGAGAAARGLPTGSSAPVDFRVGSCCYEVFVPIEHWETASKERPPKVDSPWGESFEPRIYTLSRWTNVAVYNPFDAPFGVSPDLVALQISRAAEAVTGRHVPYESIRDRYLSTGPDGRVALAGGHELARELSTRRSPARKGLFPVTMAIVGVPWFLLAAVAFHSRRVGNRGTTTFFFAAFWLIMLTGIALLVADASDVFEHWVASRWLGIVLAEFTSSVPAGRLIAWGISLVSLAAAYLVAQRQFERLEAEVGCAPGTP